jgi:hypothetical protein
METAAGNPVILDLANRKMIMLMSSMEAYAEIPFPSAIPGTSNARSSIAATGRKEMVAGLGCEHYTIAGDDGMKVDACLTRELGPFMFTSVGGAGEASASVRGTWVAQLDKNAFPLKVAQGSKTVMEVTRIEKSAPALALFAAPEGWRGLQPAMKKQPD